jgi:LysR family transcriptional regulator of gallate degradation
MGAWLALVHGWGWLLEHNLRHLRVIMAVAEHRTVTRAAELCRVSQPAVTQAIGKLERQAGGPLFTRTRRGLFPTKLGEVLARRVARAMSYLDKGTTEISPRLSLRATVPQLQAIIAVRETENFTLAAARLGITQPTVHRAVSQLEREAGLPLFERTSYGMIPSRACEALATAAQLTFAELAQAETELAEVAGREVGRIVVGGMPLSRTYLLPNVIARFRESGRKMPIQVMEGPYAQLLGGLRRGEIDFLVGALRHPAPIEDVVQTSIFDDYLALVCGPQHPLASRASPGLEELASWPWVIAPLGTPSRISFDQFFAPLGEKGPKSLVESGSFELMCQLLKVSNHLGCVSSVQAAPRIRDGSLVALHTDVMFGKRQIGITTRDKWLPTAGQRQFMELVQMEALLNRGGS